MTRAVWITLGLAAAFAVTSARGFDLDIQKGTVRTLIGRPSISDLSVGEAGKLTFPRLCAEGANVLIYAGDLLSVSANSYGVDWTIKRVPGGSFTLTGTAGAQMDGDLRSNLLVVFATMAPCIAFTGIQDQLSPLSTINGANSLTELAQQLK